MNVLYAIIHVTIAKDPLNIIVLLALKIDIYIKMNVELNAQCISSKIKNKIHVIYVMIHVIVV